MNKNLLRTVLITFYIFWKQIAGHIYAYQIAQNSYSMHHEIYLKYIQKALSEYGNIIHWLKYYKCLQYNTLTEDIVNFSHKYKELFGW